MKLLYLLIILPILTCAAEIQEPFQLRSAKGATVKVVAIYTATPEGLSFSPHPNAPLIGSTKLRTLTTPWSNVDLSSLEPYPELKKAHTAALEGRSTTLNLGPQFTDIDQIKKEISSNIPTATFHRNGQTFKISYSKLLGDKDSFNKYGNKATSSSATALKEQWRGIARELKKIDYRPEASHLAYDLQKASKGIDSLARSGDTFNITAGRDISSLVKAL